MKRITSVNIEHSNDPDLSPNNPYPTDSNPLQNDTFIAEYNSSDPNVAMIRHSMIKTDDQPDSHEEKDDSKSSLE